ncbi:putative dipeptidyl-aminopeptidase B [Leucoagaricus sp. SymC.cos]|nr:putative dipeptidyl-aminopeptidase B [Leucoagaricus sp. SymC.cos]
MLYVLFSLVSFAALIGIIAAYTYTGGTTYHTPGVKKITMDHVFNGTFTPMKKGLRWVPEAGDGVYAIQEAGYIRLVDLKLNSTRNLVATSDIKDASWYQWQLSPDMTHLLLKADPKKQWRWSSFGNYYVHDIQGKTTHPIIPPTDPSKTAYATWSPTGNAIAYVTENDLYVIPNASPNTNPIRVTTSGNASLFHGVPDWVYEEEIFSADHALWWSPDSNKIAFLAFDETLVPEYAFPVYNPTDDSDAIVPYTNDVIMKYPKPGYDNPLVTVHVFDLGLYLEEFGRDVMASDLLLEHATSTLDWEERKPANDAIIQEVAWVGTTTLLLKEVNRNADDGSVILFNLDAVESRSYGRIVRKLGHAGEEGDDGWIEAAQTIYPLPSTLTAAGGPSYLDIVPTPEGYNHIALFSPANSDSPRFLTSGEWEVTGNIKGVDVNKGLVYFEAANPSSIERHIYSVPLPNISASETTEPTPLTDATKQAWHTSDFSPEAGFYVLSYQGPGVPWQKVVKADDARFDLVLTTNEHLQNITREYEAPTVTHSVFASDGYELNVKEIRPPRMDDSGRTKYPVLFRVYGGPNSQLVDLKFVRDWHDYLACGLEYIVVVVDGRGTGFKGRKLRNTVKNDLGYWEAVDQIAAAKAWAAKEYVDPKRIGIWGWSYGGFMSSKVAEANVGIHSLAMAVAPVTSWRLYDSIYTERYMNLPSLNPGGYVNASISNVTGFHNIDFLLAHGSGDDNVHFANSAHLLDMFTKAQVRRFRFRMFTDSDHSISRRGAYREVFEFMTGFLTEKWGKGGRRRRV